MNFPQRPILWTNEKDTRSGYTLRNPVKNDGTLRKYVKIAIAIGRSKKMMKKNDVLRSIGHNVYTEYPEKFWDPIKRVSFTTGRTVKAECMGRHSGTFAALRKARIIDFDRKRGGWVKGSNFNYFLSTVAEEFGEAIIDIIESRHR